MLSYRILYSITIGLLLSMGNAASIPESDIEKRSPGFFKLDFDVKFTNNVNGTEYLVDRTEYVRPPIKSLRKRSSDPTATVYNKQAYYITNVFVGSNAQEVGVDIDTGSSDLWVVDSAAGIQGKYGIYDHTKSNAYKYLNNDFGVGYFDGSYAQGNYITDTVSLTDKNGPNVKNFEFGDATSSSMTYGVFGIGRIQLDGDGDGTHYANYPQRLKDDGFISKNAYSLYLNSEDATTGSVLFGGIDNAKYSGSLVSLPVNSPDRLNVQINSVTIDGKTIDIGESATLDSGSTVSYLSPEKFSTLVDAVGATYLGDDGFGWQNCDDAPKTFSFDFDGVSINIPQEYWVSQNEDGLCELNISEDSRQDTLGDNFLRNAYVVYDLDDLTISLAQVKYTTDSDIQPIS